MTQLRNALSNPAWVCFVWVGISIGINAIATPARFAAETITRPIALDVSRDVFVALNKVELFALAVLLLVIRAGGNARRLWLFCAALALIVLAQTVWLTPELSSRTDRIIDGGILEPSYLHATYSVLELAKLALLLFVGYLGLGGRTGAR